MRALRNANASKAQRLHESHGYLSGNYAPIEQETPLTRCSVVSGTIPEELRGGQYVRNGGNPMANADLARESHWFDGDGMLSGVLFQSESQSSEITPYFVNRWVITDVLAATSQKASRPILPSIAVLSSPYVPLLTMLYEIMRSVVLCLATWIPWTWSVTKTKRLSRISVANTSVYYHDGKVLAACESGPPMRVMLPNLETAGWWTGDEGSSWGAGIGPMKVFNEMTTAHPHTDMSNQELLLYHSSFIAPYLRVSVIPPRASRQPALVGAPVPGLTEGKLMHDFAASRTRTVVLDLPLSLDPRNLLKGLPVVHFDSRSPVRFGVFPRRQPERVQWYTDPAPACIYHTANCWDEGQGLGDDADGTDAVNFLACRLNSATLVYSAGNVVPPPSAKAPAGEEERCELYYWRFAGPPQPTKAHALHGDVQKPAIQEASRITHSFPLSRIPFEFPTINLNYAPAAGLGPNRYIYGCSMKQGSFDAGMGRNSAKIDCLVKMDAQALVKKGRRQADSGKLARGQAVDERCVADILAGQESKDATSDQNIKVFAFPSGWYGQECSFVPRSDAQNEDDGFLLFFAFNELEGLDATNGQPLPDAKSELWILDAKDMSTVVARVQCAQRVPYGLHGRWFDRSMIDSQDEIDEASLRTWALGAAADKKAEEDRLRAAQSHFGFGMLRDVLERRFQ